MSYRTGPKIVTDGLVLCLDAADRNSYPGSGSTWYDLSGNGNNGSLINGPTFSSANTGALVFDGVNDDCNISSSAISIIQGKTNFTIGVWVKMISLGPLRGLIGTLNYSCTRNIGLTLNTQTLHFYNDTTTCISASIGGWAVTDKWLYCVGTYDGTTTKVYGYKDGVLSVASSTEKSGTSNTFSTTFRIFGDQYAPYYSNCYGSVAFAYNKTLTDAEIHQNYNATKGRFGL